MKDLTKTLFPPRICTFQVLNSSHFGDLKTNITSDILCPRLYLFIYFFWQENTRCYSFTRCRVLPFVDTFVDTIRDIYVEGKQSDLRGEITRRRNTSDKLIEKLPIVSSIILNYYHARVSLQETIQNLQINKHIPVAGSPLLQLLCFVQISYFTILIQNLWCLQYLQIMAFTCLPI